MGITAEEVGRRLRIVVGGEEEFLVPPVNSQTGARLLGGFLRLGFLLALDDADAGEIEFEERAMLKLSFGAPVRELTDPDKLTPQDQDRIAEAEQLVEKWDELRQAEQYDVQMAAFFWQTIGGLPAVDAYLDESEGGGYPKALELLMEKSGISAGPDGTLLLGDSQSLLNGASGIPTPSPAATPATTTPSATGSPSPEPTTPPASSDLTMTGASFRRRDLHPRLSES